MRIFGDRSNLWWWLLSGLIFRGTIAYFLPPGFDEAYYFLYARHLDWSYFDHPLAVAFSTGAGVWLTGTVSPLTIRIGALTLFTGSLWLLYETGRWLFGPRAGWLSCAVASLSPLLFLTLGTLTAPDNALIFCWSLTLYLCAREFFPRGCPYQPTAKLTLIAFVIGLACLSKYHGFLLGLSLVLFCGWSDRHRRALRSKWMGLGVAAFCLCLLPILYWNSGHGWISFRFQLSDRFTGRVAGYSLANLLGVFLVEVGFLFPPIGLPLWWVSLKTLLSQFQREQPEVTFVLWCSLPVTVGFTLLGGLTPIYPAWPVPGLWGLTLLLGHVAARWPRPQVRRWLTGSGLALGILLLFALAHITLGTLQKPSKYALFGGFIAPQQDPSTELIDTRQLRQQFIQSDDFQAEIATTDFIVTPEYWLSGYVAMALPPSVQLSVTSFTQDPRGHTFWFDSQDWLGKDALFISLADLSPATAVEAAEPFQGIEPYFQAVTPLTQLTTQRGGAITKTFYLYRAHRLTRPYVYPY